MTHRTPAAALSAAETAAAALAPYTATDGAPMAPNTARLVHISGPRFLADRAAYGVTADYAGPDGTVSRAVFGISCPASLDAVAVILTNDAVPRGVAVDDPARFGAIVDAAWIGRFVR